MSDYMQDLEHTKQGGSIVFPGKEDAVNHPSHYTFGKYEVIQVIEGWRLPYHLGNAVKYIARAGKKNPDKTVEDLNKALWYIDRWIEFCNALGYDDTLEHPKLMLTADAVLTDWNLTWPLARVIECIYLQYVDTDYTHLECARDRLSNYIKTLEE